MKYVNGVPADPSMQIPAVQHRSRGAVQRVIEPVRDEQAIREAREVVRESLADCARELVSVAMGGKRSVTEEWVSLGKYLFDCGMIEKDPSVDHKGKEIKDPEVVKKREEKSKGKWMRMPGVAELLESETVVDGLILVRRTVSISPPDRAALIYLIDRIAGRPKVEIEHSTTDSRQTLSDTIMQSIAKVFSQPLESESNDDIVIDAESE